MRSVVRALSAANYRRSQQTVNYNYYQCIGLTAWPPPDSKNADPQENTGIHWNITRSRKRFAKEFFPVGEDAFFRATYTFAFTSSSLSKYASWLRKNSSNLDQSDCRKLSPDCDADDSRRGRMPAVADSLRVCHDVARATSGRTFGCLAFSGVRPRS